MAGTEVGHDRFRWEKFDIEVNPIILGKDLISKLPPCQVGRVFDFVHDFVHEKILDLLEPEQSGSIHRISRFWRMLLHSCRPGIRDLLGEEYGFMYRGRKIHWHTFSTYIDLLYKSMYVQVSPH